jgi:hypothetical protein
MPPNRTIYSGRVNSVEILKDGKSADKIQVDRNTDVDINLKVDNVNTLEIQVDSNGNPAWDWFHIKVLSLD